MLNKEEYLLICMMEECAEITKELSKTLRFGVNDWNPHDPTKKPNMQKIQEEVTDLLGTIEAINETKFFTVVLNENTTAKKIKLEKYMKYARERGRLE